MILCSTAGSRVILFRVCFRVVFLMGLIQRADIVEVNAPLVQVIGRCSRIAFIASANGLGIGLWNLIQENAVIGDSVRPLATPRHYSDVPPVHTLTVFKLAQVVSCL